MTGKNKRAVNVLYAAVIGQLGIGFYMSIYSAINPGQYSKLRVLLQLLEERNI